MTILALNKLAVNRQAKKRKKRVGRGNASGKGNYAGRGLKGQKARAGSGKKLALKGVKTFLQRIPKTKGFKTLALPAATVNIGLLNKVFQEGETITPVVLAKQGLVKNLKGGVKILGEGTISKKLIIKAHSFSKKAKNAILKAGGKVVRLK